jgi:hypothetical protein
MRINSFARTAGEPVFFPSTSSRFNAARLFCFARSRTSRSSGVSGARPLGFPDCPGLNAVRGAFRFLRTAGAASAAGLIPDS